MSIIRKEQLSNPLSASYALTASVALNANVNINTSSLVTTVSFNAFTASINSFTSSINAFTASYSTGSFTGSFIGNLQGTASWATNSISSSFASTASYLLNTPTFNTSGLVTTSSFNAFTASINSFTSSYNTGSFTGSFTGEFIGTASYSNNSLSSSYTLNALNALSSSYASNALSASYTSTASFVNQLNQNIIIVGNLTVFGTASYNYVTASQLDIGTNFISVNVAEPAERFGGLKVYDSGSLSHLATASLAWDSLNNHWVYQNASGSTYSGGMLMSGPRNTGSLGDELSLTRWFVARSDGGDHLNDTQIYSSGSTHIITGSLTISGSLLLPGNISSIQRILLSDNNKASIDWENRYALDIGGNSSIEWDTRILRDSNNNTLSADWENRILYDSSGNEILGWANPTTATFYGTASYANLARSASSVLVDREGFSGPQYLTYTNQIDPSGIYTALYNNDSVYLTGSTFIVPRVQSSFTGSLLGTASYATQALSASWAPGGGGGTPINTSTFATTGSNTFIGNQSISGTLTVSGEIVGIQGQVTALAMRNYLFSGF